MITETPNYARKICKPEIVGASEKCAENGFGPAVNRRVVGSSPTCGANFSNVVVVKKGFSSLSRHRLSQLSHMVLALDADLAFPGPFFCLPLSEPLSTLARAASRVETLAARSID